MSYTATQFTLCGMPAGDPRRRLMDRAITEAAARAVASYCAKFHQPEIAIEFDRVAPAPAILAWLRDAVEAFRRHMSAECAATFSLCCAGTVLDDACLDVCAELGIRITVRFDGLAAHQEEIDAIQRIGRHPAGGRLFAGVRHVVKPGVDGLAIYRHFRSLGIENMDFVLPADLNWDNWPSAFASETPFADCLIPVFDAWWHENHPDVRIPYFDKLLRLLVGSRVREDSLAADALTRLVVDWDGRFGLADGFHLCGDNFHCLDLGVLTDPVESVFQHRAFQCAASAQEALPSTCRQCELRSICGGGDLPSRFSRSRAFECPSVYCADLTKIIHHVAEACARETGAVA
jgi:uncharacterized protein